VLQPDVVSLLASKRNQGSSNDNASNNQHCEKTSCNSNGGITSQLDNSAFVIAIADTTLVNYSTRKWL